MRLSRPAFGFLFVVSRMAIAQMPETAAFEVASVKPSPNAVGPDYNNRFAFSPAGISAKNATLRRLVAEAYRLQLRQVAGPGWLDQNEYDLDTRAGAPAGREQMDLMLRTLLSERFHLRQHRETREMRIYELMADGGGLKIQSSKDGERAKTDAGLHFRGDMREFADYLAVQFSIPMPDNPNQPVRAGGPAIPVLDRTGREDVFDFTVNIRPEPGTDSFTLWQRALPEQLGLKIEARRGPVQVLVVDDAAKIPAAN